MWATAIISCMLAAALSAAAADDEDSLEEERERNPVVRPQRPIGRTPLAHVVVVRPNNFRRRKRLAQPQQQQPRRRSDFSITKQAIAGRAAKRRRLSKLLEELQRHLASYDDETGLPSGGQLGINLNKRRFHARRIPATKKLWHPSSSTSPSPKALPACRCPPGRGLGGPVCGEDGRTHLSACHAKCRGRTRAECRGRCPCVEDVGASAEGRIRDTLPALDGKGRPRLVRIPIEQSEEVDQEEKSAVVSSEELEASLVDLSNGDELSCVCSKSYRPVCSSDGVTYKNSCHAKCQEGEVECRGQCPCRGGNSNRRRTRKRVQRSTEERSEGSESRSETAPRSGKKKAPYRTLVKNEVRECACQRMLAPVCGSDGKTKSNKCMAACHGVNVTCDGSCPCRDEEKRLESGLEVALLQLQNLFKEKSIPQGFNTNDTCQCPPSLSPVCTESDKTFSNKCRAECRKQKVKCRSVCPCPGNDATKDIPAEEKGEGILEEPLPRISAILSGLGLDHGELSAEEIIDHNFSLN